jgi:hypothetical protein
VPDVTRPHRVWASRRVAGRLVGDLQVGLGRDECYIFHSCLCLLYAGCGYYFFQKRP